MITYLHRTGRSLPVPWSRVVCFIASPPLWVRWPTPIGCNRARAKDSAGFLAFSPLEPRRVRFSKDAVVQICMIDLRPNPTRPLHALSKTRRPPTRPRGHRIACARGRIRAIPRRIQGTEEEESGGSRRRPKSVILRVHAPSPWPWRRPFVRAGGSVRQRQTAGKTPPAQSSQPSAEELRARSRTGTLKFRRNPWHWRDRTPPIGASGPRLQKFLPQHNQQPCNRSTRRRNTPCHGVHDISRSISCRFRSGWAQLFRASGYHLSGCGANRLRAR